MRLGILALAATAGFTAGVHPATRVAAPQLPATQTGGRGANPNTPQLTGTGLIMGQVLDAATDTPLPGAIVALTGRGVSPPRVMTDGDGHFLFRDVPGGDLTLTASKPGYFGGGWGQHLPTSPARPLDLGGGERLGDVTLRLWRYGVIKGEVLDDSNQPVIGMRVSVLRRTPVNGRWQLVSGAATVTDDRGVYSLGRLTPGAYVITAHEQPLDYELPILSMLFADAPSFMGVIARAAAGDEPDSTIGGRAKSYGTTFYSDVSAPADATPIAVRSGEEHPGVILRVPSVPMASVSGIVSGFPGTPTSVRLRLAVPDPTRLLSVNEAAIADTSSDANGRFSFDGVAAGQYVLRATVMPPANATAADRGNGPRGATGRAAGLPPAPVDPILWAAMPITVIDADVKDVTVTLHAGVPVSGRVQFDGGQSAPLDPSQFTTIEVSLTALDPANDANSAIVGRVESDGTFRAGTALPGSYLLRMGTSGRWRPKSAMYGGRDLLDQVLDIDTGAVDNILVTFTDQPAATLTGTVHDAGGSPDAEAIVLLFPTDHALWGDLTTSARRVKAARTTRTGYYAIPGLPAGDYFIAAGDDTWLADWPTPEALTKIAARAARISLADGDRRSLDLQTGGR